MGRARLFNIRSEYPHPNTILFSIRGPFEEIIRWLDDRTGGNFHYILSSMPELAGHRNGRQFSAQTLCFLAYRAFVLRIRCGFFCRINRHLDEEKNSSSSFRTRPLLVRLKSNVKIKSFSHTRALKLQTRYST